MLIAFALTVTLMPALLRAFGPPKAFRPMGFAKLARADEFLHTHRRPLLIAVAVVALVAALLAPRARFDFNPLHLRSPQTESVATILDLMHDPETNPNTISVLASSLPEAQALAAKLDALPEVAQTITLASFVPKEQQPKLALISDASMLLDPTLNPGSTASPPDDADVVAAMRRLGADLQSITAPGPLAATITDLQRGLGLLADGNAEQRRQFENAVVPPIKLTLDQVRAVLSAGPVTLDTLPRTLVQDWIGTDGSVRAEVQPRGDVNETENLLRFVTAVQTIAPDAAGPAVSIHEAGQTIVRAFFVAGLWAWRLLWPFRLEGRSHCAGVRARVGSIASAVGAALRTCARQPARRDRTRLPHAAAPRFAGGGMSHRSARTGRRAPGPRGAGCCHCGCARRAGFPHPHRSGPLQGSKAAQGDRELREHVDGGGVGLLDCDRLRYEVHQRPDPHHRVAGQRHQQRNSRIGMIFVAALAIAATAIERLLHAQPLEQLGIGLAISALATAINWIVARILFTAGQRHHSIALEADAHHLMNLHPFTKRKADRFLAAVSPKACATFDEAAGSESHVRRQIGVIP